MFFLTIPIEHCTRILSRISQGKEIEGIQIGKGRYKNIFIYRYYDYLCRNPQKNLQINLLKQISDFSEVTDYIKIQKSILFLNIGNKSNLKLKY